MPRIVKIYAYEGHDEQKLAKLQEVAIAQLGVGPKENVPQRLLSEPRHRRWYRFELPSDSLEATFAMNALLGDSLFEIDEDSNA